VQKPGRPNCFYLSCFLHGNLQLGDHNWAVRRTPS